MAAEAAFTAVAGVASMVAVVAAFVEADSAGVDAHSAEVGGRTADRLAARIVGVEHLAAEHIAAGSRRAARDLAPDHFPARMDAASVVQAARLEPAVQSQTDGGIRSATAAAR